MYEDMTQEYLLQEMLNDVDLSLYKGEGSSLYNTLAPAATQLAKMYAQFDYMMSLAFITNNKMDLLDKRMEDFARYRKPGQKAEGTVYLKGDIGARIDNGDILTFNGLDFIVVQDIVLKEDMDQNSIAVQALEVGEKYNLPAGVSFSMKSGENSSSVREIVNKEAFTKGIDIESDEDFFNRHIWEMMNNPTSGNEVHYIQWAKEVPGVVNARSESSWNGGGNAKVLIMGQGGKPVTEEVIQTTKTYIESKRPVGAKVTVFTSRNKEISIIANLKIVKGFDINDIKADIEEKINSYLVYSTEEIVYMKILAIIAAATGVYDVKELKINSGISNIKFTSEEVPTISSINLSEVK